MATKTTKKKIVVNKKSVKKVAVPVPVAEVFSTTPNQEDAVSVPRSSVLLYVNGRNKGTVDISGQKLGAFVVSQAQHAGIRTFSVYIDGRKADTSDSNKGLGDVSKVEIVAKDARG